MHFFKLENNGLADKDIGLKNRLVKTAFILTHCPNFVTKN
jgi:hypothetical protein